MSQIRIVEGKCYNQYGYGCILENTHKCIFCANFAGTSARKQLGTLYELDAKNHIEFKK